MINAESDLINNKTTFNSFFNIQLNKNLAFKLKSHIHDNSDQKTDIKNTNPSLKLEINYKMQSHPSILFELGKNFSFGKQNNKNDIYFCCRITDDSDVD